LAVVATAAVTTTISICRFALRASGASLVADGDTEHSLQIDIFRGLVQQLDGHGIARIPRHLAIRACYGAYRCIERRDLPVRRLNFSQQETG
jgi:hypothetical protein